MNIRNFKNNDIGGLNIYGSDGTTTEISPEKVLHGNNYVGSASINPHAPTGY